DRRCRRRRGDRRPTAGGRDHDHGLHRHRRRSADQQRGQVAIHDPGRTTAPITVRTQVYGGLATGATHSQTLEAWFMHIPGMKVIVPSTPRDGKGLLTSAIFDEDPCLFVETIRLQGQKGLVPTDPGFSIPLGLADIKRPGTDVTIISYG